MMYRLRFETAAQVFDAPDCQIVLPLAEAARHPELKNVIPEIPAVLWEHSMDKTRMMLSSYAEAVCENIGAVHLCRELGLVMHGGMYLNVLNTAAAEQYAGLGLSDLTLSFEMPFPKMRAFLAARAKKKNAADSGDSAALPVGALVYGYLPLMKFRACPAMGPKGCSGCTRDKYLTDRKNEKFRILCRGSEYSELLNCVPLYAADKSVPQLDFQTLYFTTESREECLRIFEMVKNKETPSFRRTAGLYNRELL